MAHNFKKLSMRHHEILRMAFLGKSNSDIAHIIGISPAAVSCLLNSPLAKAEVAKMQAEATEKVTDLPLRLQLAEQLNMAAMEAVVTNRAILNDRNTDVKVRARVASHFMDRVVFNKSPDDGGEGSYREILRAVSGIERQLQDKEVHVVSPSQVIETQAS